MVVSGFGCIVSKFGMLEANTNKIFNLISVRNPENILYSFIKIYDIQIMQTKIAGLSNSVDMPH